MDYTKFLGKKEEVVLAYLGGPFVYAKDRRLRIEDAPRPSIGIHRFEIKGRNARALEVVDSDLQDRSIFTSLPRARGHHVRGWITREQGVLERIQLRPAEEPAPFAIVRARRWHSGDWIFESLDFDGDVEENARLRLEKLEPLGGNGANDNAMKGTPPSLRLAYGVALAMAVADKMTIALSVREAVGAASVIAEGGEDVARAWIAALNTRRIEAAETARIRAIVAAGGSGNQALVPGEKRRPTEPINARRVNPRDMPTLDNAHLRADIALDGAHARMLSSRSLGNGNLEVAFEFMGERFVSTVDALTLHVYDSGVCLAGADELVTLDSLPGVIREAIDSNLLVITRR